MCPGPLSCLRAGSWGNPASPASGRDPIPCERHRHSASAPLPALHQPLSSYPAPVCQGTPSRAGQVHTSTTVSLSRLDEQTETLPPHGVHLQPGASSCLQLVATVGEFLYINRAPNLNRYFFLFFFSVQQVSKMSEKPKEWPSPGPAQLCHPGGSFA